MRYEVVALSSLECKDVFIDPVNNRIGVMVADQPGTEEASRLVTVQWYKVHQSDLAVMREVYDLSQRDPSVASAGHKAAEQTPAEVLRVLGLEGSAVSGSSGSLLGVAAAKLVDVCRNLLSTWNADQETMTAMSDAVANVDSTLGR